MYVCICNALSDSKLLESLARTSPGTSAEHVYKQASGGVPPNCGCCLEIIEDMIADRDALDIAAE
jgi:bacterioferritin-associated ferredoxin